MGLDLAFMDKLDNNSPPTLDKTDPLLQHCVLLGVPVKSIDIDEVRQNGRPINYQTMGAGLVILPNLLVPQLEQTITPTPRSSM